MSKKFFTIIVSLLVLMASIPAVYAFTAEDDFDFLLQEAIEFGRRDGVNEEEFKQFLEQQKKEKAIEEAAGQGREEEERTRDAEALLQEYKKQKAEEEALQKQAEKLSAEDAKMEAEYEKRKEAEVLEEARKNYEELGGPGSSLGVSDEELKQFLEQQKRDAEIEKQVKEGVKEGYEEFELQKADEERRLQLEREKVAPTIIPKPKNLPGVSTETQIQARGVPGGVRSVILDMVPRLLKAFLGFIAISAVVFLIISGIMFLTAYGNDEKLGTAKKTATYAIIGLVVAILSYAIVTIITTLPFPG